MNEQVVVIGDFKTITIISSTLSQPTIKHKNYLIFFSSKDNSRLIILLIIMG